MSEPHRTHRRRPGWLPWLLVIAIVAQVAIPLQAHTVLAKGQDGQVAVLCTWDGPREVAFGAPGESPANPAERASPACLFSQLLGAANLTSGYSPPQPVYLTVTSVADWRDQDPLMGAWRNQEIRGPPDGRIATWTDRDLAVRHSHCTSLTVFGDSYDDAHQGFR